MSTSLIRRQAKAAFTSPRRACVTRRFVSSGGWEGPTPCVPGREGSGVVTAVGPDVPGLTGGDPVVLPWKPYCVTCPAFSAGRETWCHALATTVNTSGGLPDGTSWLSLHGAPLHHDVGVCAWAEEAVIPAGGAIKARKDTPLGVGLGKPQRIEPPPRRRPAGDSRSPQRLRERANRSRPQPSSCARWRRRRHLAPPGMSSRAEPRFELRQHPSADRHSPARRPVHGRRTPAHADDLRRRPLEEAAQALEVLAAGRQSRQLPSP